MAKPEPATDKAIAEIREGIMRCLVGEDIVGDQDALVRGGV